MFLVLSLCLTSSITLANHHEEGSFEEIKTKMITRMDSQISHLQESKACISNAKDKDSLKVCREKMQEQRKKRKEEWKNKKEEWKSKKNSK